ncbi:MAG: helix-turn-helix domain-containing protein [Solibacillus sp.]
MQHFYERIMTIPITVRTALKKELISTIGADRTKGVFIRYGWHSGVSDAKRVLAMGITDTIDLIKMGPKFHELHGYLDHVKIEKLEFNAQNQVKRIDIIWKNSFEAAEHLREHGNSQKPVCHNLCGYASGYLSTALNTTFIVKEIECSTMGYEHCRAICMPLDYWDDTLENEDRYYQTVNMLDELDEVTAKLKQERDNLKQANELLKEFTRALWSNQGIQKIIDLLHTTTGNPAYIESESFVNIASSNNIPNFDHSFVNEKILATTLFKINEDLHILKTPIYFGQDIRGYCAYIYTDGRMPSDLDYLLLDKASLSSSIILLNENIKINTEQNVKRNFLSDILEGRLKKEEISKIAYYLKFPPTEKYWMLTVEKSIISEYEQNELQLNEELIRHIHGFFKERNINAIVSQKLNQIIILIAYTSFEALRSKRDTFLQQLHKHCSRRFKKHTLAIGVSSVIDTMDQLSIIYNETLAALRVKNKQKSIYYFEDLELESLLFQLDDDTIVSRFVQKELGHLVSVDKDFDLTKTLYAYIESGMNINSTAKILSMSISGLRYRLSKISDLLNIQLDDTKKLFSIYMALKILRAKGEIEID